MVRYGWKADIRLDRIDLPMEAEAIDGEYDEAVVHSDGSEG